MMHHGGNTKWIISQLIGLVTASHQRLTSLLLGNFTEFYSGWFDTVFTKLPQTWSSPYKDLRPCVWGKTQTLGGGVTGMAGYYTNTLPSRLRSWLEFWFKLSIMASKMLKPKRKTMHVNMFTRCLLKHFVTRKCKKHVYQQILSTWIKSCWYDNPIKAWLLKTFNN